MLLLHSTASGLHGNGQWRPSPYFALEPLSGSSELSSTNGAPRDRLRYHNMNPPCHFILVTSGGGFFFADDCTAARRQFWLCSQAVESIHGGISLDACNSTED